MALTQKKISLSDIDIIGTYDGEKLIKAEVVPKNSIVIPPVVPPVVPPVTPPWTWPKPTAGIFAAPNGSAAGVGTVTNPMSLEKALSIGGSGQQIWLRGGTYNVANTISPRLSGSAATPWKISAYPGEEPILNFNTGARHGFFFNSDAQAFQEYRGVRFTDLSTGPGGTTIYDLIKFDRGNNLSFIHCQVDNCKRSGILSNGPAGNILFYGCVILNNGADAQFDHAAYIKSRSGTFTLENCLILNNAGTQIHGYNGSHTATEGVKGVRAIDNFIFTYGEPSDRPILFWDSSGTAENCVASGNVCFNAFPGKDETDKDRSAIKVVNGLNSRAEGNFIWGGDVVASGQVTKSNNIAVPTGDWPKKQIWVRPSRFDAGIIHLGVFNPTNDPTASVDLSGILPPGHYEIRAASSPQHICAQGNYAGSGSILVPLSGLVYDRQTRAGGFNWQGSPKANGFVVRRVP